MSIDLFTAALHQYMKTRGDGRDTFGGLGMALHFGEACEGWLIPKGAKAREDYAYSFAGTDHDPDTIHVLRLNQPVSCACGRFQERTISVEGSMGDLLTQLLDIEIPHEVTF